MTGGIRGMARRMWEDEQLLWQFLLAGAYAGSAVGTVLVLGGLADVTHFCQQNPSVGVGAGFKLEPPLTSLSAEVMRIQRAPVTNPNGTFNCGRFFRYDWTLWALQFVFVCLFGFIWFKRSLRRFMPGLVAIGAAVTYGHMTRCNYTISMEPWTKGELHTSGWVIGIGLVACMVGNFCMFLFAGPYSEREPIRARASIPPGAMASPDANLKAKGLNGTHGTQGSLGNGNSPRVGAASVLASQV